MLPRPLCCRYNKAKEADIVMMRAEKEETGRYVLFPRVKAECPEARVSQGAPAIGAALRGAMQGHKVLCVECYPGVDQEEVLACLQPVGAQLVVHSDDLAFEPEKMDAVLEQDLLPEDPVFGIMTVRRLKDFFYPDKIRGVSLR